MVPTAIAALVKPSIRSMLLKTSFWTLSVLAVVGLSATGASLLARGDQAVVKGAALGSTSTRTADAAKAERPISEQFERIKAEYEAIPDPRHGGLPGGRDRLRAVADPLRDEPRSG